MSVDYTYLGTYKSYPLILIFQKVIGSIKVFLFLFTLTSLVASCSSLPMSLLTGGGPNVAANVQAGRTNSQTLGTTKILEQKTNNGDIKSVEAKVSTESVEKVTINETQPWVIMLLVLGWLLPSPNEIARSILNLFRRKKNG